MAKEKSFTRAQGEAAARCLEELPKKPEHEYRLTTRETVRLIQSQIEAAQHKGYSLDEIAEAVSTVGVAMSVRSLKYALHQINEENPVRAIRSSRSPVIEREGSRLQKLPVRDTPKASVPHRKPEPQRVRGVNQPGSRVIQDEFSFEIRPDIENL